MKPWAKPVLREAKGDWAFLRLQVALEEFADVLRREFTDNGRVMIGLAKQLRERLGQMARHRSFRGSRCRIRRPAVSDYEHLAYEDTSVRIESSMAHIRELCMRYGVDKIDFSDDPEHRFFTITMRMNELPLALRVSYAEFGKRMAKMHPRTDPTRLDKQAARSAYRWAYYFLKLSFEGDAFGFQPKEASLLAGFLGPDGRSFAEVIVPRLPEWNRQGAPVLGLPAGLAPRVIEADFGEAIE